MSKKYNVSQATGTFNTVGAGSQVNGNAVFLGNDTAKISGLCALTVTLAETNTITLSAKWQVSNDASTWVDLANGPQNAAATVLGTGTAGADTAVTKAIPLPDAAYGFKYARMSIVVGVTTGAAGDTYTIGYCYSQNS